MNTLFTTTRQRILSIVVACALLGSPMSLGAENATTSPAFPSVATTTTAAAAEEPSDSEIEAIADQNQLTSSSTPIASTTASTTAGTATQPTASTTLTSAPATTTATSSPTTPTHTPSSSSTDTIVSTGGASANTETHTTVNTTEMTTATGTPTTTIENTSNAEVQNIGTTTADTGANTASTTATATINTGDAVATHSFVNLVNTTVVNSQGFIWLLNLLFGEGNLDMRETDFSAFTQDQVAIGSSTVSNCSLSGCDDPHINYSVVNSSTATVTNSHVLRASTGGNAATGTTTTIDTGDAYALLNGINVVNSNFIDSNYLLISINQIGDFLGDLILPGAAFFKKFLAPTTGGTNPNSVSVHNDATVENNLDITADTGTNTASTTNQADVHTGDSCAYGSINNTVNQTHIGGNNVNILVRVNGDWSGDLFGLPDGLSWEQTEAGIRIFTDATDTIGTTSLSASSAQASTSLRNKTYIHNDISVSALTGDNHITSENGAIQTGNACAVATVNNVANTSIVGSNWMSAFFNILGNFKGDISFGQPDLWIGGVANLTEEYVRPGSQLTYTYTIFNNGDAKASDIILTQDADNFLHQIYTDDAEVHGSSTAQQWRINSLNPGDSKEIEFRATVTDDLPYGMTPINLTASIQGHEPEANQDDNRETIALLGYRSSPSSGGSSRRTTNPQSTEAPALLVEKWVGTSTAPLVITAPDAAQGTSSPVHYTVVITNSGGPAYNATLYDVLTDSNDAIINEQSWQLDTIAAGEIIEISYTIHLGNDISDGKYTNTARLESSDHEDSDRLSDTTDRLTQSDTAHITVARDSLRISNVEVDATGDSYTAEIRFETNWPSDSRVVYGPTGTWSDTSTTTSHFGYQELATVSTSTTNHTVVLTSLQPATTYQFRALSQRNSDYAISDEGIFVTPSIAQPIVTASATTSTSTPPTSFSFDTPASTTFQATGTVAGIATTTSFGDADYLLPPVARAQNTGGSAQERSTYLPAGMALTLLATLYIGWVFWRQYRYQGIRRKSNVQSVSKA